MSTQQGVRSRRRARAARELTAQCRAIPLQPPGFVPDSMLDQLFADGWDLVEQAELMLQTRPDLAREVQSILWDLSMPEPVDEPAARPSQTRAANEGWRGAVSDGYDRWVQLRERRAPGRDLPVGLDVWAARHEDGSVREWAEGATFSTAQAFHG